MFEGLLDPRNGPAFDLPPPQGGDRRGYVIASSPRTGSTLLARTLWDSGLAGAPKEYLNPMQLRDWAVRRGGWRGRAAQALRGRATGLAPWLYDAERVRAHLEEVATLRAGPQGHVGLKIHWHHHARWVQSGRLDLQQVLGPTDWLWIRRRDKLAQAVSWAMALQSGRWAHHQRADRQVRYRHGQIRRLLRRAEAMDDAWARWFEAEGIVPHVVWYEDLVADHVGVILGVVHHLGMAAEASGIPGKSLRRQATGRNERWSSRFASREGVPR